MSSSTRVWWIRGVWLTVMIWPSHRGGFFRLFGYGAGLTDHRIDPPLFSERYNGTHGISRRTYIHIGPWCVRIYGRKGD